VVADETRVSSVQAQVDTAKISLNQAVANHQAGTAPLLDELRARGRLPDAAAAVDRGPQNALDKVGMSLARTIGLPLAQKFDLSDKVPMRHLTRWTGTQPSSRLISIGKTCQSMVEQTKSAEEQRKGATAGRFSEIDGECGLRGHRCGTCGIRTERSMRRATSAVPVFKEFELRGEASKRSHNWTPKRPN